jgi:alpha-amylase/alpha-mannosidase (GH57 family)
MHQPFYKDLVSGEYRLPWTRMHALKDYYGMAKILEEFPSIRQTFNLVPSMMVQVDEYARGVANDPFLALSLKPAETLTPGDQHFLLRNFFMANPARMIHRFPRYGELYTNCGQGKPFTVRRIIATSRFFLNSPGSTRTFARAIPNCAYSCR